VSRRFALVVNPAAAGGKALAVLPQVEDELRRLDVEYRVVRSDSGEHAKRLAREMAGSGEVSVAVGGDGLVGTLAGALCESDGVLAIVPSGRGNDLARVLGIPTDPAAAVGVAVSGQERRIDVGQVDGKSFVGIASLGFDSDANRIANETRIVRGNLVYAYAALRAMAQWRHARFTVVVDGERHEFTGYSVAVGNSKAFGGGMLLLPMAELDDGLLDVCVITDESSKLKYLRDLPTVFKGKHVDNPATHFFRGEVVEVSADRDFDVYADGDPLAKLPATIRVAKQALRVIVPS
jgi:YegS/Rv2252/BmrU family lipid kinase